MSFNQGLLILVGMAVLSSSATTDHPVNQDMVNDIKSKTDKWIPREPSENPLVNYTHWQLHGMLGTILKPPLGTLMPPSSNVDVPKAFDARKHWTDCVHEIRNQEHCGSCWAFAASEAFSDRICIASKGSINTVFSPEDLVECDRSDYGCNGGELQNVWRFIESKGVVTEKCLPYVSGEGKVPQCSVACEDSSVEYHPYKCKEGTIVEAVNKMQIQE